MSRLFKLSFFIAIGMILASTTLAFASEQTGRASQGGEGAGDISGWVVTGIHYEFAQDPSQLHSVEFDLDGVADQVKVSLNAASGQYFSCRNTESTHWVCLTPGTTIVSMDQLRVAALQQ